MLNFILKYVNLLLLALLLTSFLLVTSGFAFAEEDCGCSKSKNYVELSNSSLLTKASSDSVQDKENYYFLAKIPSFMLSLIGPKVAWATSQSDCDAFCVAWTWVDPGGWFADNECHCTTTGPGWTDYCDKNHKIVKVPWYQRTCP